MPVLFTDLLVVQTLAHGTKALLDEVSESKPCCWLGTEDVSLHEISISKIHFLSSGFQILVYSLPLIPALEALLGIIIIPGGSWLPDLFHDLFPG